MARDRDEHVHPLDVLVPDPPGRRPLCAEERFAEVLDMMVADAAPRMFAVVQEYGERVDAHIAAWGIALPDRAEAVSVERGLRMSLQTPEDALRAFTWGRHIRAHLVWVDPAATPFDDDEEDEPETWAAPFTEPGTRL